VAIGSGWPNATKHWWIKYAQKFNCYPENDKNILLTKGKFLLEDTPFDIDLQTLVISFIELGHKINVRGIGPTPQTLLSSLTKKKSWNLSRDRLQSELREEISWDQVTKSYFRKWLEQSGFAESKQPAKNPAPRLCWWNKFKCFNTKKRKNTSVRVIKGPIRIWLTIKSLSKTTLGTLDAKKKRF